MSEFPEIQPFGPSLRSTTRIPQIEAQAVTSSQSAGYPCDGPCYTTVSNITVVFHRRSGWFALGYSASRYQQLILSQSKIDEFLNYAQAWIREQGPKIADPIKQGLESTGSTVEQAIKKVSTSHPLESLHLFQRPKPRKFFGLEIF